MAMPSIACLGIIGKNNNPLHISIFSSHAPGPDISQGPIRTPLQFSLLLSSSLDIFEARNRANTTSGAGLSGDFGLLHALDERVMVYGFETNTGVKFVAVVDMRGRRLNGVEEGPGDASAATKAKGRSTGGAAGLREGELKVVFRAIQAAYVRLLQNPFYDPDEHLPATGRGGKKITSRRFIADIQRIGEKWMPGKTAL